jgi:hypothetical protein
MTHTQTHAARPPFSCGVFSQAEMRAVLDWMLSSYYRHYKLYQYAFTSRVTLSLTTFHPRSLVEVPPPALPPLAEALTEAQHTQQLNEQQRRVGLARWMRRVPRVLLPRPSRPHHRVRAGRGGAAASGSGSSTGS